MKKKDLVRFYNGLGLCGGLKGAKFAFSASMNRRMMEDEVKSITDTAASPKAFLEYDQKRLELCKEHAKKDDKGVAVTTEDGSRFIMEDQYAFDAALEELRTEYKEAIEEKKTSDEEYEKLLKEEVSKEYNFEKIPLSVVPNDITQFAMENIIDMIEKPKNDT